MEGQQASQLPMVSHIFLKPIKYEKKRKNEKKKETNDNVRINMDNVRITASQATRMLSVCID